MDAWKKKMWFIHVMECYSALKREGNPTLCNHMHDPGGYYAKWKMHFQFKNTSQMLTASALSLEKVSLCTWLETPKTLIEKINKNSRLLYLSIWFKLPKCGHFGDHSPGLLPKRSRKGNEKVRNLVPVLPRARLEEAASVVLAPSTVYGT